MNMRTVLLTGNSARHQYIARCLHAETSLELIITEEKSAEIEKVSHLNKEDQLFVKKHFKARAQSEQKYFGKEDFPESALVLKVPHRELNTNLTLELLQQLNPDAIILFGTSIIADFLLEAFPDKFINFHLGLSPYFKGSATNLFPLLYHKPQCIGATIHIATKKVDGGAVLHQLRPEIEESDNLHDLGNKVIRKAGELLPKILFQYINGQLKPVQQSGEGHICKINDLSPEKLRQIYMNLEKGLLANYLENKVEMDKNYPLIEA